MKRKQKTICTCGKKAALQDVLIGEALTIYLWKCKHCGKEFKYEQRHLIANEA